MSARVLVVADSHLSDRAPDAVANWRAVLDHVAVTVPDLVLHVGDATLDGVAAPEEMALTRSWLDRLGVPWRVVPGNHDVGDDPGAHPGARERWTGLFGPAWWAETVGSWRVLGVDAQLLGSGVAAESEQWDALEEGLELLDPDTPLLLALHKPIEDRGDGTGRGPSARYVPRQAAHRLRALWADRRPPVTVSGHVHQSRDRTVGGWRHLWAPSSWTWFPDDRQRRIGSKETGVLHLRLGDDGTLAAEVVRPAGLRDLELGVTTDDPLART